MKSIIEKYGIRSVWHFTDKSNLESIEKHGGLLPYKKLLDSGIEIPCTGGNDWSHSADKMFGVDKYVHLTFVDEHPMLFSAKRSNKIKNPIWLRIKPEILVRKGVRFTAAVSNKSGVDILESEEAENTIDFEVLYTRMDWTNREINKRLQAARKAEILVPDIVPIKLILDYKSG